jgi:hypothetical protein
MLVQPLVEQVIGMVANELSRTENATGESALGNLIASVQRAAMGTDNDHGVTQDDSDEQFDVYFRMSDADPYAGSIQCPLDSTSNCFRTADNTSVVLPGDGSYALLPGVLVAYKVPAADLTGFEPAVPPFAK